MDPVLVFLREEVRLVVGVHVCIGKVSLSDALNHSDVALRETDVLIVQSIK